MEITYGICNSSTNGIRDYVRIDVYINWKNTELPPKEINDLISDLNMYHNYKYEIQHPYMHGMCNISKLFDKEITVPIFLVSKRHITDDKVKKFIEDIENTIRSYSKNKSKC